MTTIVLYLRFNTLICMTCPNTCDNNLNNSESKQPSKELHLIDCCGNSCLIFQYEPVTMFPITFSVIAYFMSQNTQ